jgi:CBS domain-containing protein
VEIELIEIRDFIASRPPFDTLEPEVMDSLPAKMRIRYLRRGNSFPPPDHNGGHLYVIRSGAIEIRDQDGELREKVAEGDIYSMDCQVPELSNRALGKAVEDTLIYQLDCTEFRALRSGNKRFDQCFSDSLRERLGRAMEHATESGRKQPDLIGIPITELVRKAPVSVPSDATIQATAHTMTEHQVSSALITKDGTPVGLVTDRDLRKRCVARGLPVDRPVSEIMSSGLRVVQQDTLVGEALMLMTRLNVHHLPVMDGTRPVGMVTATDLARYQSANSAFMSSDIGKAQSMEELVEASRRLPELQLHLAEANTTALHTGEAIASITGALTRRLLQMGEEELGVPPVPYVWVAGGSQARREQTTHSDQDNALILSDRLEPAHEAYFEALARKVNDGLNACGFEYCPGDAMASNAKWRQPLKVWRNYFDQWINKPDRMALMLASIFFDLRPIYGDDSLYRQLQSEVLSKTVRNRIFIAFMAANALQHRPPLGFFRQFTLIHGGEHAATFDIKHRGVVPITDLARVFALSEGQTPVNTTARLEAAAASGALSEEMCANLVDALELIAGLRIRHQAEQIRRGLPPDNFLPPSRLSMLERDHLKDAFQVIKTMQDTLDSRFQAGRFR